MRILLAAAFAALISSPALAADVTVHDAWARPSPSPMMKAGAAYAVVENTGAADRLIAARSDAADRVELHTHIREGDVMRMRQVPEIPVPAKGSVALKPGGYHVMLMELKAPLKEGTRISVTLVFEKAGEITLDVPVGKGPK